MQRILGVDQSYTSSGFCVIDESGSVIEFGTFKSAKAMDVYDRATQVATFIADKAIEHNVKRVNIEGLAFGIRGDATRDLAGLLFTIITTLRKRCGTAPVTVIAPTSLKKSATGSGKSDKAAMIAAVPADVMQEFIEAKYKKTTGLADLCDAYWLAKFKPN
jgi:Holliday junction resolvasome RuvABC endonuclease subunit